MGVGSRLASALRLGRGCPELAARLSSLCYVSLYLDDGRGIFWRGVTGVAREEQKWDSGVYMMLSLLKGNFWGHRFRTTRSQARGCLDPKRSETERSFMQPKQMNIHFALASCCIP